MGHRIKASVAGFGRVLTWKDFKHLNPHSVDPKSKFDAHSFIEIGCYFQPVPLSMDEWTLKGIHVSVKLNRGKSWVRSGKETPELLRHEQLHYMIASIAGRQLCLALAKLRARSNQQVQLACRQLTTKLIGDLNKKDDYGLYGEVQDRYDDAFTTGTKHGLSTHFQILWDHQITHVHGDPHGTLEDLDSFLVPGDYESDAPAMRSSAA